MSPERSIHWVATIVLVAATALAVSPGHARGAGDLPPQPAYPRPVTFRLPIEGMAVRGASVESVVATTAHASMVLAKALDEELVNNLAVAPYLRAIKAQHPDKIVLNHFLLSERHPRSTHPAVFPGHWLLLNGTLLASDLADDPAAVTLAVADPSVLAAGEDIQVVALDADGAPDWSQVEQMRVVGIGPDGVVTVERAAHGSTPLVFAAGRARVAAHAWTEYDNSPAGRLWLYNFCREAPRDPAGRRLIESLAESLASYLQPGGVLEGLDGYQFDVAYFWRVSTQRGNRDHDCNADGLPDSGYQHGVNSLGLGQVEFFAQLRSLVGPSTLLLTEHTFHWGSRAFPFTNGIEIEAFPDYHRWELFSSSYQRYQYWRERALEPRLSYLQSKETVEAFTRCPDRDRGTNWKYRLALGSALLGDGYYAFLPINEQGARECSLAVPPDLDEFHAGTEQRRHYLGQPLGDAQRLDLLGGARSLLPNGDFETNLNGATFISGGAASGRMTRDGTTAARGAFSLRVETTRLDPDPQDSHIRVRLGVFPVTEGREYTVRARVRANPRYDLVSPLFAGIPRAVFFTLSIPGVVGTPAAPLTRQDVLADGGWRGYSLSFVAARSDPRASLLVDLGREGGDTWLDAVEVLEGPGDVFARRFEHGLVLVNGGPAPVQVDPAAIAPGTPLRRLAGTQDAAVNDGQPVSGPLVLPARDALVLVTAGR